MSESTAFYSQTHLFSGNIVAAIGRINEELARKITLVSLYIKECGGSSRALRQSMRMERDYFCPACPPRPTAKGQGNKPSAVGMSYGETCFKYAHFALRTSCRTLLRRRSPL